MFVPVQYVEKSAEKFPRSVRTLRDCPRGKYSDMKPDRPLEITGRGGHDSRSRLSY